MDSETSSVINVVIRGLQVGVSTFRRTGAVEPQLNAMLHACLQRMLSQRDSLVIEDAGQRLRVNNTEYLPDSESKPYALEFLRTLRGFNIQRVEFAEGLSVSEVREVIQVIGGASVAAINDREPGGQLQSATGANWSVQRHDRLCLKKVKVGISVSLYRQKSQRLYLELLEMYQRWVCPNPEGSVPSMHEARRLVQRLVDLMQTDPSTLLGLTAVKSLEGKQSTHSANTAILAVGVSQVLGVSRIAQQRLALAALVHDVGCDSHLATAADKAELESTAERGRLGAEVLLRSSTIESVAPLVCILLSHHSSERQGDATLESSDWMGDLLTVVDAYENLTRQGVEGRDAIPPDTALAVLMRGSSGRFKPAFVKGLVRSLGIYPPGTGVKLNTGESGVVVRRPRDGDSNSRPHVWLLTDPQGGTLSSPQIVDLMEQSQNPQVFDRSIVTTVDASEQGHSSLHPFLSFD